MTVQGAGVQGASVAAEVYRLKLRHTWTTTMSSSEFRDEIQMRLSSGGITAYGEGAPIVRYKENAAEGVDAGFMRAKMCTARFYADHILTKAPGLRDAIVEGHAGITDMALDAF